LTICRNYYSLIIEVYLSKLSWGNLMNKNLLTSTFKLAILLIFLFCQKCFANPVAITPADTMRFISIAVGICLFVDLVVLAIAFKLISSFHRIGSLRFLFYYLCVVITGFIVNGVLAMLELYESPIAFFALILSFVGLSGCNFFLCRVFFKFSDGKATVIAVLMGIFTNPYLYLVLFSR